MLASELDLEAIAVSFESDGFAQEWKVVWFEDLTSYEVDLDDDRVVAEAEAADLDVVVGHPVTGHPTACRPDFDAVTVPDLGADRHRFAVARDSYCVHCAPSCSITRTLCRAAQYRQYTGKRLKKIA